MLLWQSYHPLQSGHGIQNPATWVISHPSKGPCPPTRFQVLGWLCIPYHFKSYMAFASRLKGGSLNCHSDIQYTVQLPGQSGLNPGLLHTATPPTWQPQAVIEVAHWNHHPFVSVMVECNLPCRSLKETAFSDRRVGSLKQTVDPFPPVTPGDLESALPTCDEVDLSRPIKDQHTNPLFVIPPVQPFSCWGICQRKTGVWFEQLME